MLRLTRTVDLVHAPGRIHTLLFPMQRWKSFPRFFLLAVLLIGLLAGISAPMFANVNAAPKAAPLNGDVVISEFRTRGPVNGNDDEFVEFFNPQPYTVNISNWQVWGSNSSGITSIRYTFPNNTLLTPGQHYLIVRAGTGGYSGAVDGDGTFSLGFDDDGGIAIFADGTLIIDQVGMSATSAYKEPVDGSGILTPLSSTDAALGKSYERLQGGVLGSCSHTNNNVADFQLITSNPQNSGSALTFCPGIVTHTPTPTPTIGTPATSSRTPTTTRTPTRTRTPTITPFPKLTIIINEVAWGGTIASASDEWIELYNPGNTDISLVGWNLYTDDRKVDVTWSDTETNVIIEAKSYYLIENRLDDLVVKDIAYDKYSPFELLNTNEVLRLVNTTATVGNQLVDVANSDGGQWPAGSEASLTRATMERWGNFVDGKEVWATNNGIYRNGIDIGDNPINGTPGKANWISTVTLTPTNTPVINTRTPRPRQTATNIPTLPPVGRPYINEFLPRPGFDWNLDGRVDTFDEFIEIKNVGNADINLGGWRLDDSADFPGAPSSAPYTIPDLILKPGEYAIFYASQTNILLSDGGDSVRLFDASGDIMDVIDFTIAKVEDESVCRLPDGNGFGSWFNDCTPTPNLTNSRDGQVPTLPEDNSATPFCALPDTLPTDFLFAECRGYGANIWDNFYWDEFGWMGDQIVPENKNKWKSFVE